MSKFSVEVNDPAYPPGTELTVAGFPMIFINGNTVEVDEDMVNADTVPNVELALHATTGFTVSPVGSETPQTPPIQPVDVNMAAQTATISVEGGENQ